MQVRHVLSRELEVYFDKLVGLLEADAAAGAAAGSSNGVRQHAPHASAADGSGSGMDAGPLSSSPGDSLGASLRAALQCLQCDPGLHPLAPYFSMYVANNIAAKVTDLASLARLLALAHALVSNPHIQMDHYLGQLLPALSTCLLTRTLGEDTHSCVWVGNLHHAASQLKTAQTSAPGVPCLCSKGLKHVQPLAWCPQAPAHPRTTGRCAPALPSCWPASALPMASPTTTCAHSWRACWPRL